MTSILHPHVVDTHLPKSLTRDHTISSANAAGADGGAASVFDCVAGLAGPACVGPGARLQSGLVGIHIH